MRVAILSYHSCPMAPLGSRDAGGMNVYVLHHARGLALRGLQVDVFTRRHEAGGPQVEELGGGARLVHLEAGPPGAPKGELEGYVAGFVEGLDRFSQGSGAGYDLVHSHYWLSARAGREVAERWGAPHVVTFHTLAEVKRSARPGEVEPPARAEAERRLAGSADAVVVSDRHEGEALGRLYGVPQEKVQVVPGGVDLGRFHPMGRPQARKALGLNGEAVVLFVGRMDPLKGLDLLLKGAALMEEGAGVRVLVVGGELERDQEAARMAGLAAELGIGERVRFEGLVPQERLPWYYSAADVLVVPSYYESFGLTALEAMACGTPVVAARVGGLAGLVRDGETGYLVPWHCPEPFARRLEVLLAHQDLRDRMGSAALERARGMEWGAMVGALESLYRRLVEERGGAGRRGNAGESGE